MVKKLEKIAREAISSKKYKAGTKEVMKSIKGTKLLVISESMRQKLKEKLEKQASDSNIPLYNFRGSSLQLARLCGVPYRVSAISLKTGNIEDINDIVHDKE
jgi:large subunit ribosomal protein L30e